jgi:hypothetical protein
MMSLYDVYHSVLHPNKTQSARMDDISDACEIAYIRVINALKDGKYKLTEDNIFDVIDGPIKADWIDNRPDKVCPWTTIRYVIRKACKDWLESPILAEKASEWFAKGLLEHYQKCIYIPCPKIKVVDSVHIQKVGRVRMNPVDVPTRIFLVVARKVAQDSWTAELRAVKAGQ